MADFKRDLLTYGGINYTTGNQLLKGNVRFLGNGSYFQQVEVADLVVSGNAVIPGLSFDSLTVAGNVVSGGNFIGNGALMTGVTSTLPTQASLDIVGNVRAPGNVTVAGQVTTTGNVVGQYFIGNGSQLTGLLSSLPATANIDIRGNVTAPGNVSVAGQVNVTGNVVGQYFLGNGSQLSGIVTNLMGTANVDIRGNVTAAGNVTVAGQVTTTGNVVGQYFIGNGSQLTGLLSSFPATANIDIRGNVTAPGNVSVAGQVNVTGNVAGQNFFGDLLGNVLGNIVTAPTLRLDSTAYYQLQSNNAILAFDANDYLEYIRTTNILNMNIGANTMSTLDGQGNLSVLGNVIAPFFVGNGSQLTGVTSTLPTRANLDIIGNVTAPGNVVVAGQVNVVGNVTGDYFFGNGSQLTGVTSTLPTRANLDIIGNVTAPGNVVIAGQVNVTGNVAGNYFLGNGALLTDITPKYTANGTTISTSNLIFTTDQYFTIDASNSTSLILSAVGVNTGGNLVVLSNAGYIQQTNLNGYLVVPQGYVANTEVRLALAGGDAPIGSLVQQVDSGNSYLLTASPSNIDANWLNFTGANFPVNTVFGRTGDVLATFGDYLDSFIELSEPVGTIPAGNSVALALQSLQANKADIDNGAVSALFLGNLIGDFANVTTLIGTTGNVGGVIMDGGDIRVSGQVDSLGNVVAPFFIGNGSQLIDVAATLPQTANIDILGNVIGTYANVETVIAGYANITSGNIGGVSFSANVVSIGRGGVVMDDGDINIGNGSIIIGDADGAGGSLTVFNTITGTKGVNMLEDIRTLYGNIVALGVGTENGGILSCNSAVITSNVSAQYYTGNGALLSGIVTNLSGTANIDIIGNVTGNHVSTGNLTVNGNGVISGLMNVTGNVTTGGYFVGNGYYLTLNGLTLIPQGNVANAAVRLALTVPAGSLITQQDSNTQYLLTTLPASSNASWLEFTGTNFPVPSVFGRTGAIEAFPNDYNDSQIQLSANIGTAISNVDHVSDALAYLNINKANIVNGNITAEYFLGNGALLTGITAALPSIGNIDIRGNVIGTYANVSLLVTPNLRVTSNSVAIGWQAGNSIQGLGSVAIGPNAAYATQGLSCIAIGANAASVSQGAQAIAIGRTAASSTQGASAIAIGPGAAATTQGASSIAIGSGAGATSQGASSIAIGVGAAGTSQSTQTIAIGRSAGSQSQGVQAIALGDQTATISQGIQAIAIGSTAGQSNQGRESIAIGTAAGLTSLGTHSIAIGRNAGGTGGNAITMGHYATADFANSIVISAGGTSLAPVSSPGVGTLTINPIRGNATASSQFLMYNTTTKEVSYNTSGNVTGNYLSGERLLISLNTEGSFIGDVIFNSLGDIAPNDITPRGNVIADGDVKATLGNIITDNYLFGNGAFLTGVTATLPLTANLDIRGNIIGAYANVSNIIAVGGNVGNTRFLGGNVAVSGQINVLGNVVAPFFKGAVEGNVIGAYANVANIIAAQGNVASVIFNAGNVTTTGFIYQGIRSATFTGDGSQAGTTTTPNIAVQFPLVTISSGTLDLTRQNTNTRFINLSSSTRLFQVNASIPFSAVDGGTSGRGVQAFIQYTSAGGTQAKIAAAADARPNMNLGNDKGQILNMSAVVTLAPNDYFELFANSMLTVTNVVNTSLNNAVLTNPVITIVQLN